jgi:hypothetical protein
MYLIVPHDTAEFKIRYKKSILNAMDAFQAYKVSTSVM